MLSSGSMAHSREEEQRKERRRRLVQGLLMGGAAIGVPALVNAVVSRRARQLPVTSWGSGDRWDSKFGKITYQRLGEGEPLVLLHTFGPGHSALEWRRTAEELARDHEVFAPDLLGWGNSDKPSRNYDSELYLELLGDFLDQVVSRRAVLVAAGMNAAYAVQLAVDRPEQVRALALVVPLGIELHGDEPDFKDALVHRLLRLPILGTSALNVYSSRSSLSHYLQREVYCSPTAVDDALVDEHYRSSHQPGARASLAAYLSGYLNHGVRDVLPGLRTPTWIAWGRHAVSPAVESADLWLRHLPSAELEVFELSGLLPHKESPEEFCSKLELFLAKLQD